jgi:hypothetical protein
MTVAAPPAVTPVRPRHRPTTVGVVARVVVLLLLAWFVGWAAAHSQE